LHINQIILQRDAINEKIRGKEATEIQIQITNKKIEKEIKDLIKKTEYLNEDMKILEKEICDSNISKEEDRKIKRKTDVLLKLKANFPGVVSFIFYIH
jgi:ATP-dependent Lon protease